MKKVIAAALLTASVASQADAAVFNGFGAGVNAGVLFAHNSANKKLKNELSEYGLKIKNGHKTLGLFGLQFDYEMSKANSLYSRASLLFSLPTGGASLKAKNDDSEMKLTIKNRFTTELHGALGYNFCNDVAVYALAGLAIVKPSAKFVIDGEKVKVKTKTKALPVVGAGLMKKVTDKISAGIEYKHTFGPNYKVSDFNGSKISTSSDAVLARVTYHF